GTLSSDGLGLLSRVSDLGAVEYPPHAGASIRAPSAGVVAAPRDIVGDRRGDVEGRREAGVVGEPGGVEVGVVAGAVLPSGPEVEPQAGDSRCRAVRGLAVVERPAVGAVEVSVRRGSGGIRGGVAPP